MAKACYVCKKELGAFSPVKIFMSTYLEHPYND